MTKRYLPTIAPLEPALGLVPPRTTWEKNRVLTSMATSTQDHRAGHPPPGMADGDDLRGRRVLPTRRPGRGLSSPWIRHRANLLPCRRTPQLVAPLMAEVVTAPAWTPHLVRIWL